MGFHLETISQNGSLLKLILERVYFYVYTAMHAGETAADVEQVLPLALAKHVR